MVLLLFFDFTAVERREDSSFELCGENVCKVETQVLRRVMEKTRGGRGGRSIQMRGEDGSEDRDSKGGQRGGFKGENGVLSKAAV